MDMKNVAKKILAVPDSCLKVWIRSWPPPSPHHIHGGYRRRRFIRRCSWNNNLPVSRTFVTFLLLLYVSSHATASWTFYCTISCFNCLYSSKTHLSRRLLLPSPVPRHPAWGPAFSNCPSSVTLNQPPPSSSGPLPGGDVPRVLRPLKPNNKQQSP